jgi:hypothetical protein
MSKTNEPAMVIATKEEAKWIGVKEGAEERILNQTIGIEIDREVVLLAELKIKEIQNAP